MHVARDAVLVGEAGQEQQRVVGAQRDPRSRVHEPTQRHPGQVVVQPQMDVGRGAQLERDALVHHAGKQGRVFGRAHAVPDAGGLQVFEHAFEVDGAEQLSAVRDGRQTGLTGDTKGARPFGGVAAPLVVRQPEADHRAGPVTGVARGEPGERAGIERVPHAGRRDDHADLDARLSASHAGFVQDDFERGREPADMTLVRGGVHLDLEAPRALARIVASRLADDGAQGVLALHDASREVVVALEPEPAALIERHVEGHGVHEFVGQLDAGLLGQVTQRRDAHRPREVQVQMRLREQVEVTHGGAESKPSPPWGDGALRG